MHEAATGTVRITTSQVAASYLMPPVLAALQAAEPGIAVELVASNQLTNLLRREADIAVRMVRPAQASLVAKKIADIPLTACAHESYLARAGALRRVQLSDGSVIKERILRFEPPLVHAYDMAEMNALQKLLCTNMESTWRFSPAEGGTRIDWHYRIDPRGLLVRPLCVVVAKLFERAMQRCLNHIAAAFRA